METLDEYEAFVDICTLLFMPEKDMRKRASTLSEEELNNLIIDTIELAKSFSMSSRSALVTLGEKMFIYIEICRVELVARSVQGDE